jgi:surfeit locus 1 family protein
MAKNQMPAWAMFCFVAIFLSLSAWQFYRLGWKENLIHERQERLAAELITSPFLEKKPEELSFRRAVIEGHFDHQHEMYLIAASVSGKSGYHVFVPFRLLDGSVIIVNRGWVPPERRDPSTRQADINNETVTIKGILRTGMQQGLFVPDNVPAKNMWTWVDLPAMIQYAGIDQYIAPKLYMDIDAGDSKWPVGGQVTLTIVNNHLEYAITWLLMAVLIAILYRFHRRLRKPV